jgi:hypothetical protein
LLGIQGRAIPHFYRDGLGDWQLLLGTETGQLMHYNNIQLNDDFNLVSTTFEGIFEGFRSAPYMADINGNAIPDLILGNMAGGLGVYYDAISGIEKLDPPTALRCFPNPADRQMAVDGLVQPMGQAWQICDLQGRIVQSGKCAQTPLVISTVNFEEGFYIIQLEGGRGQAFVVVHP